ncbi:MAG: fumarylacetoacetate hydrolase family protein [Xanthobacteraceae bacterium]|nr:fumarylacetoacetate hydrolase family protein [Xanthobacteraceae bacterium]
MLSIWRERSAVKRKRCGLKIASFRKGEKESFGIVSGSRVTDAGGQSASLLGVLRESGLGTLKPGGTEYALADVTLLPPVTAPEKIICVGVNYANRNEEYKDGSERPKYPSLFMRTPGSFVGHGIPLIKPRESDQFDYEGEIALVIGKAGRRIPREHALDHVAGMTLCNEGSVRDWLRHGKFNVTQGKNFDASGSIGPWLVTRDELDPAKPLSLTTRVNGEIRQQDTTENLIFPFADLIAYITTFTTLNPGDLIVTGTPTGAGARFDPPKWLKAGDVVEVEVPGIGLLSNKVAAEQ